MYKNKNVKKIIYFLPSIELIEAVKPFLYEMYPWMKELDELNEAKKKYINSRGCDGICGKCNTIDWCPFTVTTKKS